MSLRQITIRSLMITIAGVAVLLTITRLVRTPPHLHDYYYASRAATCRRLEAHFGQRAASAAAFAEESRRKAISAGAEQGRLLTEAEYHTKESQLWTKRADDISLEAEEAWKESLKYGEGRSGYPLYILRDLKPEDLKLEVRSLAWTN
jgi:hypothetical protein